jgi:hypothetical protein
MSRDRSIAAPPTIGFMESILSICICAEALPFAIAIDATANSSIRHTFFTGFITFLFWNFNLCELGEYTEGARKADCVEVKVLVLGF